MSKMDLFGSDQESENDSVVPMEKGRIKKLLIIVQKMIGVMMKVNDNILECFRERPFDSEKGKGWV